VARVFRHRYTLKQLWQQRPQGTLAAFRARFRRRLRAWLTQPPAVPRFPTGPLVLLVDGLWFQFRGQPWVLYLMALKPSHASYAHFLDPVLLPGREDATRWRAALTTLPAWARPRIGALVSDNLRGMRQIAHDAGWRFQLCHFHLLLKLQAGHRPRRYTRYGGALRAEIDRAARRALTVPEGRKLRQARQALQELGRGPCGSPRIRTIVRGVLRELEDYRTYLRHPALGLPRTTSAVESMGRLLRELFRRHRAGASPRAVLEWTTAYLRQSPRITCHGAEINRFL
jgi:hypothetical protein